MRGLRVVVLAFVGSVVLPVTLVAASLGSNPQDSTSSGRAPRFVLVPTTAGSPAESGVVELGGPSGAVTDLSIRVQQLAPGLYWVVMVRKSDGSTVVLGPLSVFDSSEFEPDRQANNDPKVRTNGQQVQVLQTQAQIKIPAPIDSVDIAQLLIQDVNGTTILAGTPERP
jgi:hypothetical protein